MYNMKRHVAGITENIQAPVFSSENDEFLFTALPVAVSSWVLESIGFREIVNSTVEWDAVQCNVTPGDFTSVEDHFDLSPDMYARTLTKIHESGDGKCSPQCPQL